jgi:hypothetical protein
MASITGLQSGEFTDIDVIYSISIDGDAGQNGQVLSSDGTNTLWIDGNSIDREDLTAADTTITISGDGTYDGQVARTIQTNKVPNAITFATDGSGSRTGTFDGSSAITIDNRDNDNQLTLVEQNGIVITDLGGFNRGIATDIDADTIVFDGTSMEVAKVPNALTFTGYDTGTFDGSSALSINLVNTEYSAGDGIVIGGTTIEASIDEDTIDFNGGTMEVQKVPNALTAGTNLSYSSGTTFDGSSARTINLDDTLTGIDSITMTSTSGATSLTGNNYPQNPTTMTNFDLTSTTNLIAGAVLATKIQRTSLFKSFTNVYSEYSSNFRTSFVAQSANVMVEFRAIVRADNKVFYGGLYDYDDGSYNDDTRNRFNYNDESDQDHTIMTWWMRNLTAGTTYYISPYFRGSSSSVYIYAGHSGTTDGFAPAIMRIIDGGNNVSIY